VGRSKWLGLVAAISGLTITVCGWTATAHQTDQSLHIAEVSPETGTVEQLLLLSLEDLTYHLGVTGHHEVPTAAMVVEARPRIAEYLNAQTPVVADGNLCELRDGVFRALPGPDGRVQYHQIWDCPPGAREVTLQNRALFTTPGGYRHTGRIQVGEQVYTTVFDDRFPTYAVYVLSVDVEEEESDSDDEAERRVPRSLVAVLLVLVGVGVRWKVSAARRGRGQG
jgi:hypothetical protein